MTQRPSIVTSQSPILAILNQLIVCSLVKFEVKLCSFDLCYLYSDFYVPGK